MGGAQKLSTYDSSMSVGVREGWNQGELDIKTWSAKCGRASEQYSMTSEVCAPWGSNGVHLAMHKYACALPIVRWRSLLSRG